MSLVWKTGKPVMSACRGYFWVRDRVGAEYILDLSRSWWNEPANVKTIVAYAGPIAAPKEPTKEQLATVRYDMVGSNLTGPGGWGGAGWEFITEEVALDRIRKHLCGGGTTWDGKPRVADSSEVWLHTSVKRRGRWVRQPGRRFTAKDFTQGSSVVEHRAHNAADVGSIPTPAPISAALSKAGAAAVCVDSRSGAAAGTGSRPIAISPGLYESPAEVEAGQQGGAQRPSLTGGVEVRHA